MFLRKVRKSCRRHNLRLMVVVSACFCMGVFFGRTLLWKQYTGSHSSLPRELEEPPDDTRSGDAFAKGDNTGVLRRKKLSVKSEKFIRPFSRLPASYEKNIFPPRAPSKTFRLEPHTVIERNRANEKGRSHYFMLFIVKSSPVHTTRREIIRRTWGAVKVVDGLLLNTIFVVGDVGGNGPLQTILQKENEISGDILQTDTLEGYRNLPHKVLSAMQWLLSRSSDISSDFYTFTDDDCVMNIANIADFFGDLPFVIEEMEPPIKIIDSHSPSSVKEIQTIELYKKKTVNEVTLNTKHEAQMEKENQKKDENIARFHEIQEIVPESPKASESDSDLAENLEIYAEMDPNAKIQIERTGKDDDSEGFKDKLFDGFLPPEISKFKETTSNFMAQSYNVAYRHNAANLTDFLRTALGRTDDPAAMFRTRRLTPDAIYCGFAYDPYPKPHRRMKDKWGVTMEQYSEDSYPAFCHGGMYTMSGARMASIFAISTVTDWSSFHLEDVLTTGILREKTGVPDSKYIQRGTDPKQKPLMYYVWDSGPRVMLKMSRKWKFFTRQLLAKRFVMEAIRDGNMVSWNNHGRTL